jgi:ribonuclease P protein component
MDPPSRSTRSEAPIFMGSPGLCRLRRKNPVWASRGTLVPQQDFLVRLVWTLTPSLKPMVTKRSRAVQKPCVPPPILTQCIANTTSQSGLDALSTNVSAPPCPLAHSAVSGQPVASVHTPHSNPCKAPENLAEPWPLNPDLSKSSLPPCKPEISSCGLKAPAHQYTRQNTPPKLEFGIVVKRKLGKAHVRNRIKRRIRHAIARLNLSHHPMGLTKDSGWVIIVQNPTLASCAFADISRQLETAFEKMLLRTQQKTSASPKSLSMNLNQANGHLDP